MNEPILIIQFLIKLISVLKTKMWIVPLISPSVLVLYESENHFKPTFTEPITVTIFCCVNGHAALNLQFTRSRYLMVSGVEYQEHPVSPLEPLHGLYSISKAITPHKGKIDNI